MVESGRKVSRRQLAGTFEQKPSLAELIDRAGLNAKQRKAWGIIASMDLSSPELPPDAGALIFLYFLWSESVSIIPVQRITGITNVADVHALVDRVGESDELTDQYGEFYSRYKT